MRVRKKLQKSQSTNTKIKVLAFLLKFLVLSLPIVFIVDLNWYDLQKAILLVTSAILSAAGVENHTFDTFSGGFVVPATYITSKNLVITITWACTGVRSAYLLFALLFSMPLNVKRQLKYLAAGLAILFVVNIVRISSATLLAAYFGTSQIFDNVLWTTMLNAAVVVIMFFYIRRAHSSKA